MGYTSYIKLNTFLISLFFAAFVLFFSAGAYAVSVPSASGQINSSDGAILRGSSSTDSARLLVMSDNAKITIHKEVYKSKTSTAKKNRWYYVTFNGTKGYVRADLVDHIKYGTIRGKAGSNVSYRKGAGNKMKYAGKLKKGSELTIVLKANPVYSTRGASSKWYKVKIDGKYYYLCSDKITLSESTETVTGQVAAAGEVSAGEMTDDEFEKHLTEEGFPESYKKKLRKLHKAHPNWRFEAYQTNIDWKTALTKQTKGGTSLISKSYPSKYRDGTKQYEKGWYKAKKKVVAHYMDPRNFLNANSIYMFEVLSFNADFHKESVVSAILTPTKLPGNGFTARLFVNAGKNSNISPVFLASRARQETGGGSDAITGTKVLGKKVYNPFNIGAFGGKNPLYNGLIYAYGKGWTTPKKSLNGGAKVLAENYIIKGQYTCYYQRFNVRNGEKKVGTHQYMTNITAPYTEACSTKISYSKYGILDKPLVFEIPIYEGMPTSTKLP